MVLLRQANDTDFNKPDRQVLMKIEIFLNGNAQPPLIVTRDNYLIEAEILEEAGANANQPLGVVSSNTLTFSLYNEDGIFSPTNESGIYFNKIKTGIVVRPYFKPATDEVEDWTPMGKFFVKSWIASVTGPVANIAANDVIQDIFDAERLQLPIIKNDTYKAFYERVFENSGVAVNVSNYFNKALPWSFMLNSNAELLREATGSTFAICISDRLGGISVSHVSEAGSVRAILTDEGQLFEADTAQDAAKDYAGVSISYNAPQVTDNVKLLEIKELTVPPGTSIYDPFIYGTGNVMLITNIKVTANKKVTIESYTSTPGSIQFTINNDSSLNVLTNIEIYGIALEHIEALLKDNIEGNLLEVKNNFIQTTEQATEYKQILTSFISRSLPELKARIRGNPLLKIGDKVTVSSAKYKLNYTGIIHRSILKYNGALSGELILLDTSMFGGV